MIEYLEFEETPSWRMLLYAELNVPEFLTLVYLSCKFYKESLFAEGFQGFVIIWSDSVQQIFVMSAEC